MKARTITVKQADALSYVNQAGCVTANDFDRAVLEQCVNHEWLTKQQNGRAVTYTLNTRGKAILKQL